MASHLLRMSLLTALLLLCIFYPFFPGSHDVLATTLSTGAQLTAAAGLLLVPIAVFWLVIELMTTRRGQGNPRAARPRFVFAVISFVFGSGLAIIVCLGLSVAIATSAGCAAFAVCGYALFRTIPVLKRLKQGQTGGFNPAPLYLVVIPVVVLIVELALTRPVTEFSRNRAIAASGALIGEIEKHRAANGRYPASLLALHPDYKPSVVGIPQYHYGLQGEVYSLCFEQPRLLFDDIGTREIVMYNPRDEHVMPSHAAWILLGPPERLATQGGWYAIRGAGAPHWKSFAFD